MIRISFLSMALLGVLFSNVSLAATPQDDIQCKVEQDQVNTALHVQGIVTQSYRACSKGTIANLEVVSAVEFNGGSVDVMIRDANGNPRALKTFTADNYNGTSLYLGDLAIPTLKHDDFTIMVKTFGNPSASCRAPTMPTCSWVRPPRQWRDRVQEHQVLCPLPCASNLDEVEVDRNGKHEPGPPMPRPALLPALTSPWKATASLPSA